VSDQEFVAHSQPPRAFIELAAVQARLWRHQPDDVMIRRWSGLIAPGDASAPMQSICGASIAARCGADRGTVASVIAETDISAGRKYKVAVLRPAASPVNTRNCQARAWSALRRRYRSSNKRPIRGWYGSCHEMKPSPRLWIRVDSQMQPEDGDFKSRRFKRINPSRRALVRVF
jgi:hypothetical protein